MKPVVKKLLVVIGIAILVCCVIIYVQSQGKGYIQLEGKGVSVELGGSWGRHVTVASNGEAVEAFAGIYRPWQIKITAKDETGQEYSIRTNRGPWGELSRVEIKKDETTTIECGPPLKAQAKVSRSGQSVSVGFSITGKAQEDYTSGLSSLPEVKIVDEGGNVLSMGKFAFG